MIFILFATIRNATIIFDTARGEQKENRARNHDRAELNWWYNNYLKSSTEGFLDSLSGTDTFQWLHCLGSFPLLVFNFYPVLVFNYCPDLVFDSFTLLFSDLFTF